MKIRLQKHIRDITGISRRSAEELIEHRLVRVNGEVAQLGSSVEPGEDIVVVKGKELKKETSKELTYIMMHKPAGYLTSRYDPHNPVTVYNLLPDDMRFVFPVGRLDRDTEGLLLFTNDGDLSYKLTHPKFEIEKEYFVTLNGELKSKEVSQIEKGIRTGDFKTSPAKIKTLSGRRNETNLQIILREGQKREIKRIFAFFRHKVLYLKRLRIKHLELGDLPKGEWRYLTKEEVIGLKEE
jgi:23S rRNA pseudouridine2605 synthase